MAKNFLQERVDERQNSQFSQYYIHYIFVHFCGDLTSIKNSESIYKGKTQELKLVYAYEKFLAVYIGAI